MPVEILIQTAADAAITGVTQSIRKNQNINMDEYLVNACGERPFFVGKRRNEWDSCARAARASAPVATFDTPTNFNVTPPINADGSFLPSPTQKPPGLSLRNRNLLIAGGAVLLIGAIILINKKK
jgi:hypothetical protein